MGVLAVIVGACSPMPSAEPSKALPISSPTAMQTVGPTERPSPSPVPLLHQEDLPVVELEDSGAIAVCDPDPSAFGDVFCYDGLRLGLRALRTLVPKVDRLYLNRPGCAAGSCIPDQVNKVRVIGWVGADAFTVFIDWDESAITEPVPGAPVAWPAAKSSIAPPVARPSIEGAPREVREREAHPFCGRAKPGDNERELAISACFFDAVLEARPVEMIVITDITRTPAIFRFDGQGMVVRYMEYHDDRFNSRGWHRAEGPVSLGHSVYHGLNPDDEGVKID
jgi:hypothetical protein